MCGSSTPRRPTAWRPAGRTDLPNLKPISARRSPRASASPIRDAIRRASSRWCGRWCAPGSCPADFPLTVNAVSGYSGGGKAMIEEFENKASPSYTETVVRTYALTLVAQARAGDAGARRPRASARLRPQRRTLLSRHDRWKCRCSFGRCPKQPTVATVHEASRPPISDAALVEVARPDRRHIRARRSMRRL